MACYTTTQIQNGEEKVACVIHRSENEWEFLPHNHVDLPTGSLIIANPEEIITRAKILRELYTTLPARWIAWNPEGWGDEWYREPLPQGDLFYARLEITPCKSHSQSDEIAGALAECWVVATTLESALDKVYSAIRADQWIVSDAEECYLVSIKDELQQEYAPYVRQALVDGIVILFNTYPIDEMDADDSESKGLIE